MDYNNPMTPDQEEASWAHYHAQQELQPTPEQVAAHEAELWSIWNS